MKYELLIIDDEKIVGMLIARLVTKSGLHDSPLFFDNAKDGLDRITDEKADTNAFVIFLDINMPGFNGWDFLDALSAKIISTPVHVVIISSSINTADKTKAFNYQQVIGFFEKPLSLTSMQEIKNLEAITQLQEASESK